MNRHKFLAIVTGLILGVGGLAVAQEGYYGQQAATQPAQQASSNANLVACACGHMQGDATASMRAFAPSSSKDQVGKNEQPSKDRGASTQGDPSAPQNRVEYGGGA